ncbi:HAD family phosphatase [Candidatus Saccharibacteria bacterium]|jgi:phosphoserine phosphatase|nr:HAD family phosphatase [Candidatus Saccharibacteria bacterium]
MKIKALLSDLDGTLVTRDTSTELLELVGKRNEGERLFSEYQEQRNSGYDGLIKRINMLKGLDLSLIEVTIRKNLAMAEGTKELFKYCKANGIITIIASGSIEPILEIYKQELSADFIVGSKPHIKAGRIDSISRADYPPENEHFKVVGIMKILKELGINKEECVAFGDSRADIPMFRLAKLRIATNPKGGIEKHSDFTVGSPFDVIGLMKNYE